MTIVRQLSRSGMLRACTIGLRPWMIFRQRCPNDFQTAMPEGAAVGARCVRSEPAAGLSRNLSGQALIDERVEVVEIAARHGQAASQRELEARIVAFVGCGYASAARNAERRRLCGARRRYHRRRTGGHDRHQDEAVHDVLPAGVGRACRQGLAGCLMCKPGRGSQAGRGALSFPPRCGAKVRLHSRPLMSRTAHEPIALSKSSAKRIWLNAQRLYTVAPFGDGPAATRAAVEHLGYVQIDTINVIERCHHHILYTRIPDYQRDHLCQAQSIDKTVFEYWTHALSYLATTDMR